MTTIMRCQPEDKEDLRAAIKHKGETIADEGLQEDGLYFFETE